MMTSRALGFFSFGRRATQDHADALRDLELLFPAVDRLWLSALVSKFDDGLADRASIVDEVAQKIMYVYHGWYPTTSKDPLSVSSKNAYLVALHQRFPNVQLSFLRSCILSTKYNHIQHITEKILDMERRSEPYPKSPDPQELTPSDLFRPLDYIEGCRVQLMNEFPRLWESTIRAVMAECNQDYVRSRAKLLDISSSTWLLSNLFQLFARRQMHVPELAHPDLVEQIHSQTRERLCASDKDLAKALNQTEYESQNQLISCQCCFSDVAFEDLGHCSEGHLFCGDCIQRLVNESLFGQGTLRGQPVSCVVTEGCLGRWSDETLQRFVTPQNLELYNVMVTERELVKAGIDLIKCPFCPYSEETPVDPHAWLKSKKRWLVSFITLDRIRRASPFVAFSLSIFLTYSLTPPTLILTLFLTLYIRRIMDTHAFLQSFRLLQKRLLRDPVPVFNCQNPRCKKASCTQCHAVWEALHICHERDQESFRLFVEKAMSAALVRTCPQCHIGFSKVDGCNKITCPNCKYVMCHLCRKDIRKEKYGHFCDHFRPIPGPCQKCTKCDLYKSKEDRQAVLEAAEKAKSEWIRRHPDAKNIDFSLAQVGPGL